MTATLSEFSMLRRGKVSVPHTACQKSPYFKDNSKVRLHINGHSAGSIHLIHRLSAQGWSFDSVNFMAPAVRADPFTDKVILAIKDGRVKRYHQFHLTDATEQKDPSCKPMLGYSRSQLYLVSQSFEQGKITPKLGMENISTRSYKRGPTCAPGPRRGRNRKASSMETLMMTRRPENVVALIKGT